MMTDEQLAIETTITLPKTAALVENEMITTGRLEIPTTTLKIHITLRLVSNQQTVTATVVTMMTPTTTHRRGRHVRRVGNTGKAVGVRKRCGEIRRVIEVGVDLSPTTGIATLEIERNRITGNGSGIMDGHLDGRQMGTGVQML